MWKIQQHTCILIKMLIRPAKVAVIARGHLTLLCGFDLLSFFASMT